LGNKEVSVRTAGTPVKLRLYLAAKDMSRHAHLEAALWSLRCIYSGTCTAQLQRHVAQVVSLSLVSIFLISIVLWRCIVGVRALRR